MARRPYVPVRPAPFKFVQRFSTRGFDHLLSEIREHTDRGDRVRVCRWKAPSFFIVRNASLYLVLPPKGCPIGSFENIAAAVIAGDEYAELEAGIDCNHDNQPNGAA